MNLSGEDDIPVDGHEHGSDVSGSDTDEAGSEASHVTSSATSCEAYTSSPWFLDAKYGRYWRHEERVRRWFQQHTEARSESRRRHMEEFRAWCTSASDYHRSMAAWMQTMGSYYSRWYSLWLQTNGYSATCDMETLDDSSARKRRHHVMAGSRAQSTSPGYQRSRTVSQQSGVSLPSSAGPASKRHRSKSKKKGRRARLKSKREAKVAARSVDHADGGVGESGEVFEMEITDDMLDFFVKSAKHRLERDAVKEGSTGDEDQDYVNLADITQVTSASTRPTVLPPGERPGVKRTSEMKHLYGSGAALIHGMETAMQLNFDRNCDRQQPRLWPNIPISIKFRIQPRPLQELQALSVTS